MIGDNDWKFLDFDMIFLIDLMRLKGGENEKCGLLTEVY